MTLNFVGTTSAYQSKYGSVEMQKQVHKHSSKDDVKLRRKHKNIQKAKTVTGDILKVAAIGAATIYAAKNPQKTGKLLGTVFYSAKNALAKGVGVLKTVVSKIPAFVSNVVKHAK